MARHSFATLAGALAALAVVAPAGAQPSSGSSAQGAALAARVSAAYQRVPGVKSSARVGLTALAFTQTLHGGVVTAEQFEGGTAGSGTTTLIGVQGSPTYRRQSGATCWRALPTSDPQTLTDLGHPFLSALTGQAGITVAAPQRTLAGWVLTLRQGRAALVLTVTRSYLITAVTATKPGQAIERLTIRNLARTPPLLAPRPLC